MAVALIEGELAAVAYALQKIGIAGLWIRHFVDEFLHIGDGTFEAFVNFSLGAFDVGYLAFALESLAFQDDLASVLVGVGDGAPDSHGIGVLLGGVNLHLDGEGVVLAQNILNRVYVMLTHIGQAASVIVEVSAEGLVGTVYIIRFIGCGAEPEVVIQLFGNGLYLQVFLSYPVELPGEAGGA